MFPPPQFPGHGPSSPCAPRVRTGPPGNHPVNWPTSSSSITPPQLPSGTTGRHHILVPTKRLQPSAEPRTTNVTRIADLHSLPEMYYDQYEAADECDDSSNLGGAEGKPRISLEQTKFSLMQFARRMGQANYSAFNKCKKVWVAGFLEKKNWSIIQGQNRLKQV